MTPHTLSNHLKAVMLIGNISDQMACFYQSDCLTVQHFDYSLDRALNKRGIPVGNTNVTTISVTVRIIKKSQMKIIFSMLEKMECNDFSFLFNATFAPDHSIFSKEDAMVVRGVVVEIDEHFKSVAEDESRQILLSFKILASDITYMGTMFNKVLTISKI